MTAMQIANSMPLWLACGCAVVLVIAQAAIFIKKAFEAGPNVGLTSAQMKKAAASSARTSIGPSVVILSGMLSLLVSVGGPMAWMRLSFIGSVMFESIAAGIGTSTVGVTLGVDEMTGLALTMAVWTMILGSVGWIIFSTFAADKMDKVQNKIAGGDPAKLGVFSSAAILGTFSAMATKNVVAGGKGCIATLLGAAIMFVLTTIANKKNIGWLKEWGLTIAMLGAMIITALV